MISRSKSSKGLHYYLHAVSASLPHPTPLSCHNSWSGYAWWVPNLLTNARFQISGPAAYWIIIGVLWWWADALFCSRCQTYQMHKCVFSPLEGKLFFSTNRNSLCVLKKVLFSGNARTKFPLNKMLYFYFLPSEAIEFIARIQLLLTVWFELKNLAFDYTTKCHLRKKSEWNAFPRKVASQGIFYFHPTLPCYRYIVKVCF